jgi:PKD repeat protein
LLSASVFPNVSWAQGDQTAITVKLNAYQTTGAWLHLPDDYKSTSSSYPLLIFLHGVGEGGTNVYDVLKHGVPKVIANGAKMQYTVNGKLFKFIVVSPQIPNGWASATAMQSIIDDIKARYRVDASRIYLTGLSAGGYGVLNYVASGSNYSDNLAAIVPVSPAAIDKTKFAGLCNIASSKVAMWTLCGTSDSFIKNLRNYTADVKACGATIVPITTEYAGGGHDDGVWDKAYDAGHTYQNPNIYEWMLKYSRNNSGSTLQPPVATLASTSLTITLPTNTTTLDGSTSTGTITTYAWSQVSGPSTATLSSTNTAKITASKLVAGTYVFKLTVSNSAGSSSQQVTVKVNAATAAAPVAAVAATNISMTLPANTATLDGSASTGNITSYTWKQTAGPNSAQLSSANAAKITASSMVAGTYGFSLTVQNSAGSSSKSVSVTVQSSNTSCSGCKFLVQPAADGGAYINGDNLKAKPGDTVCIQGGDYKFMQFFNFTGTAAKPIVFINCGGQVRIGNGGSYGFVFNNAKFVKVTGTGSSDKYGFKVDGVVKLLNTGLGIGKGCSDYEADHFELTGAETGVMAKINPDCDVNNTYPTFAIRNVKLHDLYIHDVTGEGMYVGNTAPNGETITCNGVSKTVLPPRIYNLKIYNVITNNTGWDGIQVASAPEGVEVFNNQVSNYGTQNKSSQQAGILLGGEANGKVYNNIVKSGTGNGIQVLGMGLNYIYNNIITDCGNDGTAEKQDAIFIDDRPTKQNYKAPQLYIMNNTIVNSGRDGIRFQNTFGTVTTGNLIMNNLVVKPGSLASRGALAYLTVVSSIKYTVSNNLNYSDASQVKFLDAAAKNFHLSSTSPVIDQGKDLSAYFKTDIDGLARPQGNGWDVGAVEYGAGAGAGNAVPTANAGAGQTITLPVATVTLNGTGSLDSDGTIRSYLWAQSSGPATATFSSTTAAAPVVTKLTVAGSYVFKLTVTDDKGATASSTVTITVKAAAVNVAPTASAGSAQTITLPATTATLNGSGSKDSDGTIQSYTWSQTSGPSTASFSNTSVVSPVVSKLTAAGAYVFKLVVTDNNGATGTSTVTITVKAAPNTNVAPTANAGSAQTITLPTSTVTLNGSGSKDSDGTIKSYAWSLSSGPATPSFSSTSVVSPVISKLSTAGSYVFKLVVTDDNGATGTSTVTITVKPATNPTTNTAPVANAGSAITITLPRNSTSLSGVGSTDSDGYIVSYNWVQVSGPGSSAIPSPSSASPTVNQLSKVGTYVFRLTVTDNDGATATDVVNVIVNNSNSNKLVANAGVDQQITLPSVNTVTLTGAASTSTNYISYYGWEQVSGPSGGATILNTASKTPVVTFTQSGTYVFRLTVTDTYNFSATDEVTVVVGGLSATDPKQTDVTIQVYPNPTTANLNLRLTLKEASNLVVRIYNSSGYIRNTYYMGTTDVINRTFDVSGLTTGVYILEITDGQSMKLTSKFIKN